MTGLRHPRQKWVAVPIEMTRLYVKWFVFADRLNTHKQRAFTQYSPVVSKNRGFDSCEMKLTETQYMVGDVLPTGWTTGNRFPVG
jgi:hypothetical protein